MNNVYGYEVYKDVVIAWDEDRDTRIKTFIDELSENERFNLVMCNENKGDLTLWWTDQIPEKFQSKKSVVVEGDYWNIFNQFHWVGR